MKTVGFTEMTKDKRVHTPHEDLLFSCESLYALKAIFAFNSLWRAVYILIVGRMKLAVRSMPSPGLEQHLIFLSYFAF